MEGAETFLLAYSKTESEMLPVIAVAKIAIEFLLAGNQIVEAREILVAQRAQPIRDCFLIDNFMSHEPEGVNKWKADKVFPIFAKVPKLEFAPVFLPETNRLVADEQARRSFSGKRCRCCHEPRPQLQLAK